ncbi:MAG: response regulator [Desulfosarcinaceae bacterium]|nr:response regulator [Desulfosarcinaceae bacterium]
MQLDPHRHLIYLIVFPVLGMGLLLGVVLLAFALPPLHTHYTNQVDNDLRLASRLSIAVCDNGFNYLLDLRLEEDAEIRQAVKEETLAEIRAISRNFDHIHLMVVEGNRQIVADSIAGGHPNPRFPEFRRLPRDISRQNFGSGDLRVHLRYFPFWDWDVVSYITEEDYLAPIRLARRIVTIIVVGSLTLLIITLLIAFRRFIGRPIRKLMTATEGVAEGHYQPLPSGRQDEIGRLVNAFNSMQARLERKDADLRDLFSALETSEKRFRSLFENALLGIGLVDRQGRFKEGNGALLTLVGCSRARLEQVCLTDLCSRGTDSEVIQEKLTTRNALVAFDVEWRRVDGSCYDARLTLSHLEIDGEPLTQVLAEDRTKERALEARLQRAEKMEALGTLAGGVAHDLNNILSAIVGYPDMLLMDLSADSPMIGSLAAIKQSGERAAAIVQDLLTLARRGVVVNEVVNLNIIVEEYLKTPVFQKLCRFHPHIRVETHLASDLLNVKGSALHLAKTVMNLVSNASEAIQGTGTVVISTENRYVDQPLRGYDRVATGEYATMTVTDTGEGISPEDLEHIFEPFFTKKVMGRSGTGLGMAVVWGTVKDHKGYIDVSSTQGKGTVFTLYLPATREALAKRVDFDLKQYKGKGEHILVVDDVPEQRDLADQMLSRLDYQVTTVPSGEAAVAFVEKEAVDLVILDMIMDPGIDGLETFTRLSKRRPGIKVVIASGYSQTERVQAALDRGAGAYLKKPYSLEKLATTVRRELIR